MIVTHHLATAACRECVWLATARSGTPDALAGLKADAQGHSGDAGHVVDLDVAQRLTFGTDLAQAAL